MSRSPKSIVESGLRVLRCESDFYLCRLRTASLEITKTCNLRCVMCDFGRTRYTSEGELDLKEWKDVLDGLVSLGVRWINFIGAEPMVREGDVLELARYLNKRGVVRQLNTNGMIMTPSLATTITQVFEKVVVSIDGPREKHNQIRGQAGAFERACEGIRMIVEARRKEKVKTPYITIHATILNGNYDALTKMVDIAEDVGGDEITFQYVSQTPRENVLATRLDGKVIASERYVVRKNESFLLNKEQVARLKEQIREVQTAPRRIQVNFGLLPYLSDDMLVRGIFPVRRCYATRGRLVVFPQGDVGICSHLDYCLGNVRRESLEEIWKNDRHRRLMRTLSKKLMPVCAHCCHFAANLVPSQYLQLARGQVLK